MFTFYYPSTACNPLPTLIDEYELWQRQLAKNGHLIGPACWVVQTFLRLRDHGFPCQLTQDKPREGVVVAHYDDMPSSRAECGDAYWVCVLADRANIHPFANFYIIQNPYQRLYTWQPTAHILHWIQPGIIARSERRGRVFENVKFYGERLSLCAELLDSKFERWCAGECLNFEIVARDHWSDYSDCDVVIAIRNFPGKWVHDKPASKLVNAWQARVPAILGRESSYRAVGNPGVDYRETFSVEGLKLELLHLRDNPDLVDCLVASGTARMDEVSNERVVKMWVDVVANEILPRAAKWERRTWLRVVQRIQERLFQGLAWRYKLIGTRFVDSDRSGT